LQDLNINSDTGAILTDELEDYNYEGFIDRIVRLAAHRHPVWGRWRL